jgi:hypothetical protein
MKLTKSGKNNWKKTRSMKKSWVIYLKNTMTKTIVNMPSWIWKDNSKKWKINMKEMTMRINLKDSQL